MRSSVPASAGLPGAASDLLGFEDLLGEKERSRLEEVRGWLSREVLPIAVGCWDRAEFPHDLIPRLAELDVVSPVRRQGHSHLLAGLVHAEFTRADA